MNATHLLQSESELEEPLIHSRVLTMSEASSLYGFESSHIILVQSITSDPLLRFQFALEVV